MNAGKYTQPEKLCKGAYYRTQSQNSVTELSGAILELSGAILELLPISYLCWISLTFCCCCYRAGPNAPLGINRVIGLGDACFHECQSAFCP